MTIQFDISDHLYKCLQKRIELGVASELDMLVAKGKVVEQEPKTGHWIDIMVGDMPAQVCDQCKTFYPLSYTGGGHKYCPSCGSRMVEPQESEV